MGSIVGYNFQRVIQPIHFEKINDQPVVANVSLNDILSISDNSRVCNFFNHIRNFINTAIEYVVRGVFRKKFDVNFDSKNEHHSSILNLNRRGTQLTTTTLSVFFGKQEDLSRGYLLNDLAGNDFEDRDFDIVENFKTVSIPVRVEGFKNKTSHIVNIKIKNVNGQFEVEFFDSRGFGLSHPTNANALKVVEQFVNLGKPVREISSSLKRLQTDGHSCGVFVAWHATHDDHLPPKEINEFRSGMLNFLEKKLPIDEPAFAAPDWDGNDPESDEA